MAEWTTGRGADLVLEALGRIEHGGLAWWVGIAGHEWGDMGGMGGETCGDDLVLELASPSPVPDPIQRVERETPGTGYASDPLPCSIP